MGDGNRNSMMSTISCEWVRASQCSCIQCSRVTAVRYLQISESSIVLWMVFCWHGKSKLKVLRYHISFPYDQLDDPSITITSDDVVPVGRMEVNSLSRLDKVCAVSSEGHAQSSTLLADLEVPEEDDPSTISDFYWVWLPSWDWLHAGFCTDGVYPHFDQRCRIFELDACQNIGKVCLVYHNTKQGT